LTFESCERTMVFGAARTLSEWNGVSAVTRPDGWR
jgi:hypothetical protein